MEPSLTIVVPVYNEESRLATTFAELDRFARHHPSALEIVFVSDGSKDRTEEMIRGFTTACPVRVLAYMPNRGKGAAVRAGMLSVRTDYGLMIDADMSTPMDQIEKFLPFLREGAPVVIGTRKNETANVVKTQAWHRQKMGEVFTALARIITGVRTSDFTCGFKCFSRNAIAKIFPRSVIDRWSYDAEILYLAQRAGLPIREVGVVWKNDEQTKVRLGSDAWKSFVDLVRIPFIHRKG